MLVLYNIFFSIAYALSFLFRWFIPKFNEREKNIKSSLQNLNLLDTSKSTIWFHAASVGEFEQAKPIIELLKEHNPEIQIVCSFFSPSAFNTQRHYPFADAIIYLPLDLPTNTKKLINKIKPKLVVFVRYELWANYLNELKNYHIPVFLVNATAPNQNFFNRTFLMKKFYKYVFSLFDAIFTVNATHTEYFTKLGLKQQSVHTLTDTRFDRIAQKVSASKQNKLLPDDLLEDELIFIAGSIWKRDFEIIKLAIEDYNRKNTQKITSILVPHEPNEEFLQYIESNLPQAIRFSKLQLSSQKVASGGVLLVDSTGKLLMLYSNAKFAYVGGAFGVGVHSLTEPAGYGLPVACGPNCYNSPDAKPMLDAGALRVIHNDGELRIWISEMANNNELRNHQAKAAYNYVHSKVGSTQKIIDFLSKYLV